MSDVRWSLFPIIFCRTGVAISHVLIYISDYITSVLWHVQRWGTQRLVCLRFYCKKYSAVLTKIKTRDWQRNLQLSLFSSIVPCPMLRDRFFGRNKINFLLNRSGHLTLKHVILEALIALGWKNVWWWYCSVSVLSRYISETGLAGKNSCGSLIFVLLLLNIRTIKAQHL